MQNEMMKLVNSRDPAIDREAMGGFDGVVEYAESRELHNFDRLKFIPGRTPMVFHARELPHYLVSYVLTPPPLPNGEPSPEQAFRAFRCCVLSVDNILQQDGYMPGNHVLPRMPNTEILSDETFQRFEKATIIEIGEVALRRSLFHLTTGLRYPLPPLCRAALADEMSRPAASSQNSPTQTTPAGEASSAAA